MQSLPDRLYVGHSPPEPETPLTHQNLDVFPPMLTTCAWTQEEHMSNGTMNNNLTRMGALSTRTAYGH